jgi:hypothetical protein
MIPHTNDLVTLVKRERYAGCDWHDAEKTFCCLKEEGSYFIKHPLEVIANDIIAILDNIGGYDTANSSKILNALTTSIKTKFVSCEAENPDAILEPLGKEESIDAYKPSYDGYLLWFLNSFEVEYAYTIQCFEKKDLCYFAYENFLCPRKGVPTCQRLYTPLRASLDEAEEDFANLKLHDKYRSVKELEIVPRGSIDHEWLRDNLRIADILKQHPELDTDQYFEILINSHLNNLQRALDRE